MSLLHGKDLARTLLLAASALDGPERERAENHLKECEGCRSEFEGVLAILTLLEHDPVHHAEPPVPFAVLKGRVEARLRAHGEGRKAWVPAWRPALAATAAVVLSLWSLPHSVSRKEPSAAPRGVVDEGVDRLERTLAREDTARYLSAAQEVLVNVATPGRCPLKAGRVDVGEESRRSRALLVKRTLLVGNETTAVASAQPVLDDVERVLREVASLDPCASKTDLDQIHREVSERRLLLRIDLMTRELEG
jgi:hypothetical protein